MAYASYERQHLSVYAAGFITADGTSAAGFGCQMTRVATGVYAAVFSADNGLVNDESYTFATRKNTATGLPIVALSVEDTSNLVKTIFAQGIAVGAAGTLVVQPFNTDLEVAIYRTVTH